jgi:hypothetical protein
MRRDADEIGQLTEVTGRARWQYGLIWTARILLQI